MRIEIITPDKTLYAGEGKSLTMPGIDGRLGILNLHAPLITALKAGQIRITDNTGKELSFDVKGGTAEVLNNKVLILAE
jgi:F-type H+-transporting ATPase subunit epsilon